MFYVCRRVLQGCPPSGSVWASIFDPVSRLLSEAVYHPPDGDIPGEVGGCADDVGTVLPQLRILKRIMPHFRHIQRFAFLRLQQVKCCIVPLWAECTPALAARIRAWIAHEIPECL
eukprot:8760758-Pyramimonas_sp.AAC.1